MEFSGKFKVLNHNQAQISQTKVIFVLSLYGKKPWQK